MVLHRELLVEVVGAVVAVSVAVAVAAAAVVVVGVSVAAVAAAVADFAVVFVAAVELLPAYSLLCCFVVPG